MTFDKEKSKHIIAVILAILWMGIIFCYSAQPSEESTATSMSASFKIVKTTSMFLGFDWQDSKILEVASNIEGALRKVAHMVEYAILAVLWHRALVILKKYKDIYIPFVICVIYAASDEIHQLFVPGRHGMLRDVLIDSAGAIIMLALICIYRIVRKQDKSLE